jgi:hypothetical protein
MDSLERTWEAGRGNRTLVFSLEGYCSTIELHPQGAADDEPDLPVRRVPAGVAKRRSKTDCRWGVQDSNLRRQKPSDLQSDPVDRLGNSPRGVCGVWCSPEALLIRRSDLSPERMCSVWLWSADRSDSGPATFRAMAAEPPRRILPATVAPCRRIRPVRSVTRRPAGRAANAELAAGVEPATC